MTTRKLKKPRKPKKLTLEQLLNAEPHVMEALVRIYSAAESIADSVQDVFRMLGSTFGIRDIIALAALQGDSEARSPGDRATYAYLVADAMLIHRAKELLREPEASSPPATTTP